MRRILFLQGADPYLYPPIVHASSIMADAGWHVTLLSTPQSDTDLSGAVHPDLDVIRLRSRSSFKVSGRDYFHYCQKAVRIAKKLKPQVIYASDPLGALPGLIASKLTNSRLVYHEHDTPPSRNSLHALVHWARRTAAQSSSLVIFPNADRASYVQRLLQLDESSLRVVWNVPSCRNLPVIKDRLATPFILYYHGSITPERLPEAIPHAISRLGGSAVLRIAGYEAPSGKGYVAGLQERWGAVSSGGIIDWVGALPYPALLRQASECHVGLALMPMESNDINMTSMIGASNKAFDYMAAGMPLMVSDLPDWRRMFVDSGFAVACDPRDVLSVEASLKFLFSDARKLALMGVSARRKIEDCWNYELAFSSIVAELDRLSNK